MVAQALNPSTPEAKAGEVALLSLRPAYSTEPVAEEPGLLIGTLLILSDKSLWFLLF